MLSNLAHLRQTSGRLLADLHGWRLTTCAHTFRQTSGRPPWVASYHMRPHLSADLRQTSGRPPADLQQTSSRYVHLEHSTTSAAPGALLRPPRVCFLASTGLSSSYVSSNSSFELELIKFVSAYRQLIVLSRTGFEPRSLNFFVCLFVDSFRGLV